MKTTPVLLALLGVALGVSSAHAVTTITNCAIAPVQVVNKKTIVNLPAEDVVIQCALMSLPGSDQTQVTAKSIVVDGPSGGSVSSSGKGGQATFLAASGAVTVDKASVVAANSNGNAVIQAGGNVSITVGSNVSAGDTVQISCTGPLCTIDVIGANISANKVRVAGVGTVTFTPSSTITTSCPRDEVRISSSQGDVVLSGGTLAALTTICCNTVQAICTATPNDPACPFYNGGKITLNDLQELSAFCSDCDQSPNVIQTCIEGNVYIDAPLGNVLAAGAVIRAGEAIIINALANIDTQNAQISNCGPKTGPVILTSATCNSVQGATILDDDPELTPTLNCAVSGVAALLGTCSSSH
jgi:hypothetical protein